MKLQFTFLLFALLGIAEISFAANPNQYNPENPIDLICSSSLQHNSGFADLMNFTGTEVINLGHPWRTSAQILRVYKKIQKSEEIEMFEHKNEMGRLRVKPSGAGEMHIYHLPHSQWHQTVSFPRISLAPLTQVFQRDDVSTLETYVSSVLSNVEARGRTIKRVSLFFSTEQRGPKGFDHKHENPNLVVYGYSALGKGTEFLPNGTQGPPKNAMDYTVAPAHSTVIITGEYHRAPIVKGQRLFLGVAVFLEPL